MIEKPKVINDLKLQEKIGWTPHSGQKKIIDCHAREKIICAGRRFGKSDTCAYEIVKDALLGDRRIWIAAPSYELSKIVFDRVVIFLSKVISPSHFRIQMKPFPTLTLTNGSIIEGKSCEARSGMLGRSTNLVVIDEAALVDENIWQQYIKPTTHEQKGRVVYIGTPRGLNWFYDKFLELQIKHTAFQFKTSDNPLFDLVEYNKARESLPEKVFAQEYEAEFLTEAGLVFRGIDLIVDDTLAEPVLGTAYILGVDIARHTDYTALTVMDRTTKKVVYLDRFKELDYPYQKQRILTLSQKYNNAKIIIDSTGMGDSVASDLMRQAFVEEYPLYSHKAKQQLIDRLIIFIEQRVIRIPNNEILINELKKYEVKVLEASGKYNYSAPRSGHDDMVISLALATWGLQPNKLSDVEETETIIKHNDYE